MTGLKVSKYICVEYSKELCNMLECGDIKFKVIEIIELEELVN